MTEGEIITVINDYLDRGMGSTIEQVILRRAAYEIKTLREQNELLERKLHERDNRTNT